MRDLLAVYGTLLRGAGAWELLRPHVAEHLGELVLPGELYDTGRGYPAFRWGAGEVPAQLVRLTDPAAALPVLDEYEGPEYERAVLALPDGRECWVYTWLLPVAGMRPLPGGWLAR